MCSNKGSHNRVGNLISHHSNRETLRGHDVTSLQTTHSLVARLSSCVNKNCRSASDRKLDRVWEPHPLHQPFMVLDEVAVLWTRGSPYKCHAHNSNIKKVPSAIEESESAGSRWELNTGPLGCPAGALSLSYDNQTTTGLHNPLYAWCVQLRHFSTTCAVHIEDCEGWCLSGCCAQWQNTGCTSRPGFDSKRPSTFSLSLISLQVS